MAVEYGMIDFRRSIRSAVHCYWAGTCDLFGFTDTMVSAISRGYKRAWGEGLSVCGMTLSDITPDEQVRLDIEIANEISYILNFADAIDKQKKDKGGKVGPLYERSEMWVNRYGSIRDLAMTYGCADTKLMWVLGVHCVEHCTSCKKLAGRVYRASTWRKYDIYPRKHDLACGGYHCCCEFLPTDAPVTPGRPPYIP